MYEFEVKVKNIEEEIIISGYSLKDACRRRKIEVDDVEYVATCEYID